MYRNSQIDRNQDDIFLDEGEGEQSDEIINIIDLVYREVGSILLEYTNQSGITIPNILHYITLKFDQHTPKYYIFQPNFILVEQMTYHTELKEIAETLQINDLINTNQNDPDYFQEYYSSIVLENFKSLLNTLDQIILHQLQLILNQKENLHEQLKELFKEPLFQFPVNMTKNDTTLYQIFQTIFEIQQMYITSPNRVKQEFQDIKIKQEQIEQPLVVTSINKEKIKLIIHWLINQKIPVPEIILCAELKSRGNGMNLTFNPNQQILDAAARYHESFCQANVDLVSKQVKQEENLFQFDLPNNKRQKGDKIIEYQLLTQMLALVVEQKDALKDRITSLVKYSKLKQQIQRLSRVCEQDTHYKFIQHFIRQLENLESLYNNTCLKQEDQELTAIKSKQVQDDNSDFENLKPEKQKFSKRYQRLLKAVVKLILIECVEQEIPVPEIMTCLWFKKHKEKIVDGQIINQNSIQILPSKQRLIPILESEDKLKAKNNEVKLNQLLSTPDTAIVQLDYFENQLSAFKKHEIYHRDILLIEKLLMIVQQKKLDCKDKIVRAMNDQTKIDKTKEQLKDKLQLLPKLRTNKTQINDEPVLSNILRIMDDLKQFINDAKYSQSKPIGTIRTRRTINHSQIQQQQVEKLDKEGLKIFILSALVSLIDNEIVLPEIILYLGIKNKTQKFSLQINKNQKLQEYLARKLKFHEIEVNESVESKLLLKKIKVQEGEPPVPVIANKSQVSEPQLIIKSLRLIANSQFTQLLQEIWSKPSVQGLKNQVYKNCLKKNQNGTTIGQIKHIFQEIDLKNEQYVNNQL